MAGLRQNNLVAVLETHDPIQIKNEYDVIVAGAGSAGVAAAVVCAREGLTTLLIEKSPKPGGNVAEAMVHSICGLYRISPDAIPRMVNGGFALEFAEKLLSRGAASGPFRMDRLDVLLQEPALFSALCEDLCAREKLLATMFGARIEEVEGEEHYLTGVRVSQHPETIRASAFIDTTGEAALAFLSGATVEDPPPSQLRRPSYIFSIGGVAIEAVDEEGRLNFSKKVVEGIRDGDLDPQLAAALLLPTPVLGRVSIAIDIEAEAGHYSPFNPSCLTRLQIVGHNLALQLESHLRRSVKGFENCVITGLPAQLGIREGRRIPGRYQLTGEDLLEGREFEDTVCLSAWPVELRSSTRGSKFKYPANDKPCGIPLRALLSQDFENLLMAGRCVSSTHEAQGALRVVGTCLAMGQAAGLAASSLLWSAEKTIPLGAEPAIAAPIRATVAAGVCPR